MIEGHEPYAYAPAFWARTSFRWLDGFPRFTPDVRISERTELDGGLVAIPAPGHTPGHLAFHAPDHRVLFAGDSVWNLPRPALDWRSFSQDWELNRESVRELADLSADAVIVGHGAPIMRNARESLRALVRDQV